ncbi:MAG: hypothetical protein MK116_08215 [Phycisphaerales bacterium]|nr:hypothetical protein [Phycisphaerales bacterium]
MKNAIHRFLAVILATPMVLSATSAAGGQLTIASAAVGFQGGPYFSEVERGMYYPSYLERDSGIITEELGLSDVERALVEQIIYEYVRQFEEEARVVQAQVKEAMGASKNQLSNWSDRQNVRKRASKAMIPSSDPTKLVIRQDTTADRLARVQQIIREEIEMGGVDPMPSSPRTSIMRDWSARRMELENELLDKFDLIRGLDSEHWAAVTRALRRLNTAWKEEFRAEETDLDLLLAEHFGRESTQYQDLYAQRAEYAEIYDELLQNRNMVLASTAPEVLDARDRTQLEELLSLAKRRIASRTALVDANLDWLERCLEGIENEQARASFRAYALGRIFPDLHRGDPAEATIEHLMQSRMLDAEQMKILAELKDQYRSERDTWREVAIILMPNWERDRLTREVESSIIGLAYRGWMNGLNEMPQSLRGWRAHLDAGVQLDLDYQHRVRDIVGETVYRTVPGRFRSARPADPARGPVPAAAKRRANVVYWDDMMKAKENPTVPAP